MLDKNEFNEIKKFKTYDEYIRTFEFDMSPNGIKNTVGMLLNAPEGWDSIVHPKGGKRDFCTPRYLSMYAMREFGKYSLQKSAGVFGQSHCNAIYATKTIENALHKGTDPVLKELALKVIRYYKSMVKIG